MHKGIKTSWTYLWKWRKQWFVNGTYIQRVFFLRWVYSNPPSPQSEVRLTYQKWMKLKLK